MILFPNKIHFSDGLNLTLVVDDRKSHVLPMALNDLSNTIAASVGLNQSINITSQPFKATGDLFFFSRRNKIRLHVKICIFDAVQINILRQK